MRFRIDAMNFLIHLWLLRGGNIMEKISGTKIIAEVASREEIKWPRVRNLSG